MSRLILVVLLLLLSFSSQAQTDRHIKIRSFEEPDVDNVMEIDDRFFTVKRVGRGKLGSRVVSGDTYDGDSMTIVQAENGDLFGNVLMNGSNYRVLPNGELQKAGRIRKNDVLIRKSSSQDRMIANDDVGIVDRWHNPGHQNMIRDFDGNYYGFWGYTDESDRSITYVDVFAYIDNNIPGHRAFLDAEFALANLILQRSNVYIRLNLVGFKGINLPVEKASTTLTKMDAEVAPFNDIIQNQRNTGADLVHTFASTDTRRDMCGVSYLGGYKGRWDFRDGRGVTVCHGGESFVHEIAHAFGSDHDSSNAANGFHFWYSLGYNKKLPTGFDYISTVMSYGNAEVGVFSNPDLYCKGEPCGQEEQADNARSLNETRKWVAAYNGADNCTSNCGTDDTSKDDDDDGVTNEYDVCPNTPPGTPVDTTGCPVNDNNTDNDSDNDGVDKSVDNCPNDYNPSQADNDNDGIGNVCDTTPDGNGPPTMSSRAVDISSHGGVCTRSRSVQHDYQVNFKGFQNMSSSTIWAICPITRGHATQMIAAEVTVLPVTTSGGSSSVRCDLVEIFEGAIEDTVSLSVNPNNTNQGESTHVFDPVSVTNVTSSSFAIECQIPQGHAITNIRQVSGK